jgi:uncharacterized protein (DUF697 family)
MSWLDTLDAVRSRDFKKATEEERDKAARDVINLGSYACAVVSVAPIPFSDAVLMLPMQSAMVMTVGHIYGRTVTQANAKDLIVELGATVGVGMLARQGLKALLPVVGALLTVPAAFAANWGIGRVAMEYFKDPEAPRERLKKVYTQARDEGKGLFSREAFERFRKGRAAAPRVEEPQPAAKTPRARKKKSAAKKKRAAPAGGDEPAPAVAQIIEEQFAARIIARPQAAAAIGALLHLDVTGKGGGRWTVDLTRSVGHIRRGLRGAPKLTVRASADDFLALMEGRKDAQLALLTGSLVLEPMDLDLARALTPFFSKA